MRVFLKKTSIPLTNNEAERCIRGFVIQRKIVSVHQALLT
ncbi:transposase [Vibrio sp. SG41-7]|nr:transposase [Vibrio sp. SG41-7]